MLSCLLFSYWLCAVLFVVVCLMFDVARFCVLFCDFVFLFQRYLCMYSYVLVCSGVVEFAVIRIVTCCVVCCCVFVV